jgi:hypothetical protein
VVYGLIESGYCTSLPTHIEAILLLSLCMFRLKESKQLPPSSLFWSIRAEKREAPLDHDDPGREDHDAACIPEAVCRVDPRIQGRTNHDVHTLLFGRTTNGAINNFFAFPASSSLYGDSTMNNKSILRILFLVSLLIQPAASSEWLVNWVISILRSGESLSSNNNNNNNNNNNTALLRGTRAPTSTPVAPSLTDQAIKQSRTFMIIHVVCSI